MSNKELKNPHTACPVCNSEAIPNKPGYECGSTFIPGKNLFKSRLCQRIGELREELKKERLRLAACGVIALANTPEAAAKARNIKRNFKSASSDDVAAAVDREMKERSRAKAAEKALATSEAVNQDLTARLKRMAKEGLATADLMPIHDCQRKDGYFRFFLVVDKDWAERLNDSECIYHGEEWGKHECTREYKIGEILEVCLDWEECRSYSIEPDATREGLNFCDAGVDEEYDWVGEFYSTREAAQDALCQERMIEIPAEIRKLADEKAAEVAE
jgi:hypothetical protein